MRTSALVSLLPLLVAGIATAHPHPHTSSGVQKQRKSISYGPSHPHKTFEGVDQFFTIAEEYDGDWREVAKAFLGDKIGDGWFIRDDVSLLSLPAPSPASGPLQSYLDTFFSTLVAITVLPVSPARLTR
jgi:hypothetical protein